MDDRRKQIEELARKDLGDRDDIDIGDMVCNLLHIHDDGGPVSQVAAAISMSIAYP